ncbi:MAG: hypothetical protein PHW76_07155 [Alphaproteobacteria bacterium]|nr:hypothetical protein [Alphaproteobacteria bacterium]
MPAEAKKGEPKSSVTPILKEAAKLVIPYATSVDCWKNGERGKAVFWLVVDTAALIAFIVPPAGAAAEAGVASLKTGAFLARAGKFLKVAEAMQKYPKAAKFLATTLKAVRKIAPVAHKVNDLKVVREKKAARKFVQTARVAAAAKQAVSDTSVPTTESSSTSPQTKRRTDYRSVAGMTPSVEENIKGKKPKAWFSIRSRAKNGSKKRGFSPA